jgi:phosphotransferase system HPr (HPr) family protein
MAVAESRVTVQHPTGLHARPAALFVRTAAGFSAAVRVTNLTRDESRRADAKSIINLMTLGVEQGHELLISADGDDADEAVVTLISLVKDDFGERPSAAASPCGSSETADSPDTSDSADG